HEAQRGGAVRPRDLRGREEHDDEQRDQDHADRLELTPEVRHGALFDGAGDLLHLLGPGVGGEDAAAQAEAHHESEERGHPGGDQPEPLGTSEVERLVPAFAGEDVHHALFSFLVRLGASILRTKIWRATFSPTVRSCPSTSSTRGPSNGCFSRTSTCTPGRRPRVSRKATTSGSVEPGTATTAESPGSRLYSGGSSGMSAVSGAGMGSPCGHVDGRWRATKSRSSTSWGSSCSNDPASRSASFQA